MGNSSKTRLNKYIAHSGYCTRREAADLIKKSKVTVDGKVINNPGFEVDDSVEILIEGKPLQEFEKLEYWLINKPKGFKADMKNLEGKHIIGLAKESTSKRLTVAHPMGEQHTGLHILSNDKALLERLDKKGDSIKTIYHIKLDQEVTRQTADEWEEKLGDAIKYVAIIDDPYYDIAIESGADQVDHLATFLDKAGNHAERIDRIYYSGLIKKDMPRGWCRPLTEKEVIMVKHFS